MAWSRLSWRFKRLWGFHGFHGFHPGVHPGKCNVYEYIILFRRCLMLTGFQYLDVLLYLYGLNWKNIKSQLIQCFVIQGLGLVPTRSPASRWGPLVRSLVSLPCTLDQWHRPGSSGSHKDMPPACQRAGSLHPPPVSGSIEMFLYMYM